MIIINLGEREIKFLIVIKEVFCMFSLSRVRIWGFLSWRGMFTRSYSFLGFLVGFRR